MKIGGIKTAYTLPNKPEDLSNYSNERLLEIHENIFKDIKQINYIKIDGVNPIEFRKKLINTAKDNLKLIETVLTKRNIEIPHYGIIWEIKKLLKLP